MIAKAGESTVRLFGTTSALVLLLISAPAVAMPAGMGAGCQRIFGVYEASKGSKAFAKGNTKACGYAYGKANIAEARKAALNFCRQNKGDGCRVVESE